MIKREKLNDRAIYVPDGLETVEDYAFEISAVTTMDNIQNKLTVIEIPKGLVSLGNNNFILRGNFISEILVDEENNLYTSVDGILYNYTQQTIFKYPCAKTGDTYQPENNCLVIDNYAFYNTQLKYITITPNVQRLGDHCFYSSTKLETIDLTPNTAISELPNYTFSNCWNLVNIMWNNSIEIIGAYCFHNCSSITELVLPDTIRTMAQSAIMSNRGLHRVVLPKYLKLNTRLVLQNDYLEEIVLPVFSETIGEESFVYNSSFPEFVDNSTIRLVKYTMREDDDNKLFKELDGVIYGVEDGIVRSLIRIPYGYENLTIPETVIKIMGDAGRGCSKLKNFILPENLELIETAAFMGCTSLTEMTIPSKVKALPVSLFFTDRNLTKVVVESTGDLLIYGLAFADCYSLSEIVFKNKIVPRLNSDVDSVFRSTGTSAATRNIIVERGLSEQYFNDKKWNPLFTREIAPYEIIETKTTVFATKSSSIANANEIENLRNRIDELEKIIKNLKL